MKCPKCGYLGFDQVDRCRNCGYEFSLAPQPQPPAPELTLKGSAELNPLEDLSFLKAAETPAEIDATSPDLPLFGPAAVDDEPLIVKPSPPRQPLAVRRATPEVPRLRSEPRAQSSFDLAFEADPAEPPAAPAAFPHRGGRPSLFGDDSPSQGGPVPVEDSAAGANRNASLLARLAAVIIDLVILAIVDVVAVYLTMELSGLALIEFGVLPKAPLLGFLILQNGGYLVGFTAGGQTLGKMALGIRVIAADETESMTVGRALQRTVLWAILASPAGLGFLTAVFSSDHRGLHDRLAGTRVVRASA